MSPPSIRRRCHEFKKHRSPLICLLLMCPTSKPCHEEADFDVWDSGDICICRRKVLRTPNDAKKFQKWKDLYTVVKGQRDDVWQYREWKVRVAQDGRIDMIAPVAPEFIFFQAKIFIFALITSLLINLPIRSSSMIRLLYINYERELPGYKQSLNCVVFVLSLCCRWLLSSPNLWFCCTNLCIVCFSTGSSFLLLFSVSWTRWKISIKRPYVIHREPRGGSSM